MERFLVTGGAGFIGSNIIERLLAQGAAVRVIDDFSTGRRENLAGFRGDLDVLEGSVADSGLLEKALGGTDFILHLAAVPSVQRSMERPLDSNHANVTGTLALFEAARRNGKIRRLVFASSSSVYGDSPEQPKVETLRPSPISVYGATKLAGELYAEIYRRSFALPAVCLRYFNVFGPRQNPRSQYAAAVPNFITAVMEGRAPVIYGDGTQTRDFTYVENVVEANLAACRCALPEHTVFNVACGSPVSVLELYGQIAGLAGFKGAPRFEPPRIGDIKHSCADVARAKKELGFTARWTLSEGMKKTFDWYKAAFRA